MVFTHVTSLSANQVVTAIQGLIDAADEQLKKRTVDDEDQVSTKAFAPFPRRTSPSVAVDSVGKCNILDTPIDSLQTPKENPAETTTTEEKVAEESKDEQQTVKVMMNIWRFRTWSLIWNPLLPRYLVWNKQVLMKVERNGTLQIAQCQLPSQIQR